jgi:UDP-2,3-diacylglucosamine hydrolase
MRAVIVSDVHLNVASDGRSTMECFTRFLRSLEYDNLHRFVVLGDLFDFWFEYGHVIFSGYFEVLREFAAMRDAGIELHFVCGNHDFWAGRFLRNDLGFAIHADETLLEFDDRRVLLVHGDGINPDDVSYRLYKRVARARPVVALFRLLHPDWAMAIAQGVSRGSRHMKSAEDVSEGPEVEPQRRFAAQTLQSGRADAVMCGHSHYPTIESMPAAEGEGLYINTGDWLYHRSYIEWANGRFHLKYYE